MYSKEQSPQNNFLSSFPTAMKAGYLTHDVFTNPPTPIQIVSAEILSMLTPQEQEKQQQKHGMYFITFDDIEPTAGWLADRNNASLDICFMHSFGKCYGKAKDRDPRTCHQIHVKREVLNRIRQQYILPHRTYFCRTIKCNISSDFILRLSLLAKRRLTLQYLEFKTEDVIPTYGSLAYEVEYRNWLLNDHVCTDNMNLSNTGYYNKDKSNGNIECSNSRLETLQHTPMLTNFISKFNLCPRFSMNGKCEMNSTCGDIHVDISKALSKDRTVRFALEQLSRYNTRSEECSQNVPALMLTSEPTTMISSLTPVNLNDISFDKQVHSPEFNGRPPPPPPPPPPPLHVFNNLNEPLQRFNLCQPLMLSENMPYNMPIVFPNNNTLICTNEFCGNSLEGINTSNAPISINENVINNSTVPTAFLMNNNNSQSKEECLCTAYAQNVNNNRLTDRSNHVEQIQRLVQIPLQNEEMLSNNQVCHNIVGNEEHNTYQHLPYLIQSANSTSSTLFINNSNRGNERYSGCNNVTCSTPMFVVDEHG